MRIVQICAVVIAVSIFADTVQNLYGWSNVKPVAEDALYVVNDWAGTQLGWKLDLDETAENAAVEGVVTQTN